MFAKNAFIAFIFSTALINAEYKYTTNLKLINPSDTLKEKEDTIGTPFETKVAVEKAPIGARDNGGNYGDLIYKYRQNGDTLLLREVVIADALYSNDQDIHWTVSISGGRISSVRVLNFGRERAYCLRIDVAAGDAEVVLRIPPLQDPRVMIEIYGF